MRKFQSMDGIAGWKIDHPLERLFARWADKSEWGKSIYVWFYRCFDKEYYQKGLRFIDRSIATFAGEVTPEQRNDYIKDMVYSLHRFGCSFDEYFLFGYPHLNTEGRNSFITEKKRWEYYARMNLDENKELFNDKRKAYALFGKFYKRELIEIQQESDAERFYDFLSRHSRFIVKPYNGSGGHGIFIADLAHYPSREALFTDLLKSGHIVVEELIRQAPEMAVFNTSSVNTVRIPTLLLKDRVVVFEPFLRTGIGNSVVDNASSGGILCPVDPDTGICLGPGKTETGQQYMRHPVTNTIYPGFCVPRWEEAVTLVTELAYVLETNHYVGWDLALTDEGWVMVEGNPRGQLLTQYATQKGIRKKLEQYISQM